MQPLGKGRHGKDQGKGRSAHQPTSQTDTFTETSETTALPETVFEEITATLLQADLYRAPVPLKA
jgi:hypothetical protein